MISILIENLAIHMFWLEPGVPIQPVSLNPPRLTVVVSFTRADVYEPAIDVLRGPWRFSLMARAR